MWGWKKRGNTGSLVGKISHLRRNQKQFLLLSFFFYWSNSGNKRENEKAVDVDCRPSSIIWQNPLQSLAMKGYIHWTEHIGQVAVLAYE